MKNFFKLLAHAFIGGVSVALTMTATSTGVPLTVKNVLYPALAAGFSSVVSLLSKSPLFPEK